MEMKLPFKTTEMLALSTFLMREFRVALLASFTSFPALRVMKFYQLHCLDTSRLERIEG
jgi:hypothetical protein